MWPNPSLSPMSSAKKRIPMPESPNPCYDLNKSEWIVKDEAMSYMKPDDGSSMFISWRDSDEFVRDIGGCVEFLVG